MSAPHSDIWTANARAVPIEDEIARRGIQLRGKVERCGPCPKCGGEDRFSINTVKQIFNCRGCGVGGDVIDLVQHLDGVDFNTARATLASEPPLAKLNGKSHAAEPKKIGAAKYQYQDEAGNLAFGVARIEYQNADGTFVTTAEGKRKKTFLQYRPDPEYPGKSIWNVNGVAILPYQLPELIEAIASGHFIVVAEGEAKVDLLRSWNVPATCNAGGAGKWKPEHSKFLLGADVVILPDNDAAGRAHCDVVGASLQGIAASVRVLELPGLRPKQDIKDWAAKGGTVEQLHDLIAQEAKPWTPSDHKAEDDSPELKATDSDAPAEEQSASAPLSFINIAAWHGSPAPAREWAVLNRIPLRNVTLLSGEGGVGKSILALHLAAATSLARDWLGTMPEPGPTLVVCCEDDEHELRRRLDQIVAHYSTDHAELSKDVHAISLAGQDAVMAAPDKKGIIEPTSLFTRVRQAAYDIQPRLIVIDNSADVFAGSENDRAQVRQFITLLRAIAIDANAGLLLTSHPSLTGVSTGTGLSGSTAWNASVRSRLYFKRATTEKDEEPDPDLRVLEVMKANYGPVGETIMLRWKAGLFLPIAGTGNLDKLAAQQRNEHLFLTLLNRFNGQGRNSSDKPNAPTYAPAMFAKEREAKEQGIRKGDLEEAMRLLFEADKIWLEPYGAPSKATTRLKARQ